MHKFIKKMTVRELCYEQLPSLAFSFIIAELFYKFHSFTLECLAFLGTWYLFDFLIGTVMKGVTRDQQVKQDGVSS